MGKIFTAEEDEILIEQVKKYPPLFNHENKDFKNPEVKEKIWIRIAPILDKKAADCKGRWKNIRDNYLKHKRRKVATGVSTRPPKWNLYKFLTFLDMVNNDICPINDFEIVNESFEKTPKQEDSRSDHIDADSWDNSQPSRSFSHSSTLRRLRSPAIKKRKMPNQKEDRTQQEAGTSIRVSKETERDEDEVDLFMRSVALMMKKLPLKKIAQAKLRILRTVTDLQLSENSNNDTNSDSDL